MRRSASFSRILLVVLPALFAVVMLVLIYFKVEQIKSITNQLVAEEVAYQQDISSDSYLKNLKNQDRQIRQQYEKTLKMIPKEPMEESLITDLQQKAALAMVDFVQIKFNPREQKNKYMDMPMDISFTANYRALIQFLKLIRNDERAIRMDCITVSSAQDGTSKIRAEITAHSFCLDSVGTQQTQQ